MKKVAVVIVCAFLAAAVSAQSINLDEIELSDLNLMQADLSDAELYFAGPVDLLVRGVKYMGRDYSALLMFDGRGTVEIGVPANPDAVVPYSLDLSEVRLSLVADGIRVDNVIADGYYFSGKLVPTADLNLAVAPGISMGGRAGVVDMSDDVAELTAQLRELRSDLASAEAEKNTAMEQLADAESQIGSLESRLQAAGRGPEDPLGAAAAVNRIVRMNLGSGSGVSGSWSMSGTRLRQTSTTDLYAKYTVPVSQSANELVYTFSGSGAARGWSGFGIHILGTGARNSRLYGFGQSYLVWVTRDPGNTQSDQTYLQLYRSYDDVRMVQLASRAIPESITSNLQVTAYVNRSDGRIVLGVNDEAVITYDDPAIIRSGSQVAARTLGPATFTGFSIKSR